MRESAQTERLRLTPYGPDDVATLERLFRDPEVARYLFDGETMSSEWIAEEAAANATRWSDEGLGVWLVALLDAPSDPIGFAGIRPFFDEGELQLLYGLLPTAWHQGYATEAANEVLRRCFEEHAMTEVLAVTDRPNVASMRVLERLGFRLLEVLWRFVAQTGSRHEMVYFRLGRERWRSLLASGPKR